MSTKQALSSILAILLFAFTSEVLAKKQPDIDKRMYQTDDCYMIHYNAVIASFLPPATAHAYGITRSKKRALLVVSVRKPLDILEGCKKGQYKQTQAVTATVTAQAANLEGRLETLEIRPVEEGDADSKAIYYLDDFRISNTETWNFTIIVVIDGQEKEHEIKFSQQFFVD